MTENTPAAPGAPVDIPVSVAPDGAYTIAPTITAPQARAARLAFEGSNSAALFDKNHANHAHAASQRAAYLARETGSDGVGDGPGDDFAQPAISADFTLRPEPGQTFAEFDQEGAQQLVQWGAALGATEDDVQFMRRIWDDSVRQYASLPDFDPAAAKDGAAEMLRKEFPDLDAKLVGLNRMLDASLTPQQISALKERLDASGASLNRLTWQKLFSISERWAGRRGTKR